MIDELLAQFYNQVKAIDLSFNWLNVAEVLIIVATMYAIYRKFIKNTQAEKLVKGILYLALAWAFSEVLIKIDLRIIGMFIQALVTMIALSLIVIFQPELRRFLGYLGQGGFFNELITSKHVPLETEVDIVKELIESVKFLSKNKIGALIVFQNSIDTSSFFDVGTKIDAII